MMRSQACGFSLQKFHKAKAAEILGIGRATIYQMLSKMKTDEKNQTVR